MDEEPIWKTAVLQAGLILILFRFVGLSYRYLLQGPGDSEGLEIWWSAVLQHISTLLLGVAGFLLLWKLIRPLRQPIGFIACCFAPILMVLGQIDFTLSSITGNQFTPTVLRTYRGPHIVFSPDFIEPLRAHWLPAAVAVTFLFVTAFVLFRSWWRQRRVLSNGRFSWKIIGALLAVSATGQELAHAYWKQAPPPVEVAFLREYLGEDGVRLRTSEKEAISTLREFVGLPKGARWISERYPLVYQPAEFEGVPNASRKDHPDIIVVMVESWRSADVRFLFSSEGVSNMPHVEALASRGVLFPFFISAGFPTTPNVVAFHTSSWPHYKKEILVDFKDKAFDGLPIRLNQLGYRTLFVGGNPGFDKQYFRLEQWYNILETLYEKHVRFSDKNIIQQAIKSIQRLDRQSPGKPVFAYISTVSTHYPYQRPFDEDSGFFDASGDSLPKKYQGALRYADQQLGRLLTFLNARSRAENTLLILLGDHSMYTDLKKTTGLPVNDAVWTPLIFSGPERLVGSPRKVYRPASHIDLMPTILAMLGDVRPTASLGRDLFSATPRHVPWALSIRQGGMMRFDKAGFSLLMDSRPAYADDIQLSFPGKVYPALPQSHAFKREEARRLHDLVLSWSYLIENDRIWNPAFLRKPEME